MNPPLLSTRASLAIAAGLLLSGLLVACASASDADLRLADAVFDAHLHAFPWRHRWLTETLGHRIIRSVLVVLGIMLILVSAWDAVAAGRTYFRLRLRLLALCALLIPSAVAALKRASAAHCPWDLMQYGGGQPYHGLFEHVPAWVESGHCLPSGHASAGLWLMGLAVFWLPHRPRRALAVALAMLAFGAMLGWLQQLRGAHFLSHTLWSMWIACAILTLLIVGSRCSSAASGRA
jgi:membrane-associated PAP2 superfamily phosphatase